MPRRLLFIIKIVCCGAAVLMYSQLALAQGAKRPAIKKEVNAGSRIKVIDIAGLHSLLKPAGKPLMINFWATWCDPCRDEFPELVKLNAAYQGKIDLVTVSLDDLADINTYVPKFLAEMKADMPAYLLHTPDEDSAIAVVSKEWNGDLPFTILISPSGATAYLRKGKIKYADVTAEIDKLLLPGTGTK